MSQSVICFSHLLRSPFCVRFFSLSFLSCLASLSFSRCILSVSFFLCESSLAWSLCCFFLLRTSSTLVFLNRAEATSKGVSQPNQHLPTSWERTVPYLYICEGLNVSFCRVPRPASKNDEMWHTGQPAQHPPTRCEGAFPLACGTQGRGNERGDSSFWPENPDYTLQSILVEYTGSATYSLDTWLHDTPTTISLNQNMVGLSLPTMTVV